MTTAQTHAPRIDTPADDAPAKGQGAQPAVTAHQLGKCFRIYTQPALRLVEWCSLNHVKHHTDFWALTDINLSIAPGECFGIIGENGSGKSTLVKLLAGTLYPTTGSCQVHGTVLSLMELGTGLNTHLTGRQNVLNLSRLLKLDTNHARERMDSIESFAELGAFFDRPVGMYSAGMRLRLTFSTFAAFKPDVLLIDEALSVGDVFFQQRCAARIRHMLASGMTLVLVTHDMAAVQNLCDRVLLLRAGHQAFLGESEEAVSRYLSRSGVPSSPTGNSTPPVADTTIRSAHTNVLPSARIDAAAHIIDNDIIGVRAAHRHGRGGLRILAARVTDTSTTDTLSFEVGQIAVITLLVEATEPIAEPRAGVRLFDRLGNHVFGAGTAIVGEPLPPLEPGQRVVVRFDLTLDLKPGRYTLGMAASTPPSGHGRDDDPNGDPSLDPNTAEFHDSLDKLGPIQVRPPRNLRLPFFGLARLPMTISHEVVRDA